MTSGTSPDLKHGHILVVDDNEQNRKLIALQLRRAGYTAVLAEDGEQALEAVATEPPDLILLDLQMPRIDGFAVCAEVRAGERSRGIPIVILTASQEQADKRRALDVGADDFLTKPIDETDLLARVRSLLRVKGLYDELAQRGDQIAHQADELAKSNAELVKLAEELEQRVAERTRELEARNEEIRVMSQQLWQAAKLATMGELAASVAHELNNPLATVSLRVESLLAEVPADDPKHRALAIVGDEADRMARLVSRLLEFSRRSGQQISTLDVREEIEKTLDLVDYHLRSHGIAVMREFTPRVRAVHADRQQLRQVFLNLFTNASDAMPGGGTLTIRVGHQPVGQSERGNDPHDASVAAGSDTELLAIEITDTGVGISPEDLPRVTDGFFTTKEEGKGTGLGLAICQRILQEHHGTLTITSEVGQGTTVRLLLPSPTM